MIAVLLLGCWATAEDEPANYSGTCDISAAVVLDADSFIAADDENNTLRAYRCTRPGPPDRLFPWDGPLGIDPATDKHPEADIEGATLLDGRIYWISSHGRNKDGKWRSNRHRLFAMTVVKTETGIAVRPFGEACKTLVSGMTADERLRDLGLAEAIGKRTKKSKKLAPKREGLNIEGLCAAADGRSLLIGFRNPRPKDRALLVPLQNPTAVLGAAASPQFGTPILLDLRVKHEGQAVAMGIRSIEYSRRHGAYLIVAGPHDQQKIFALFRWSGTADRKPTLLTDATAAINRIDGFTPEALIVYPDRDAIQLLSDDGTLKVKISSPAECQEGAFDNGHCEAKHLLDDSKKSFKSVSIKP